MLLYLNYQKTNNKKCKTMKRSTFEQYVTEYCEDLALKENSHQYKRCRHACVLTYNDVIISSGVNLKLFNDFTKQYNNLKALHAEPVAIMRAMKHHSKIIHKCELWSYFFYVSNGFRKTN